MNYLRNRPVGGGSNQNGGTTTTTTKSSSSSSPLQLPMNNNCFLSGGTYYPQSPSKNRKNNNNNNNMMNNHYTMLNNTKRWKKQKDSGRNNLIQQLFVLVPVQWVKHMSTMQKDTTTTTITDHINNKNYYYKKRKQKRIIMILIVLVVVIVIAYTFLPSIPPRRYHHHHHLFQHNPFQLLNHHGNINNNNDTTNYQQQQYQAYIEQRNLIREESYSTWLLIDKTISEGLSSNDSYLNHYHQDNEKEYEQQHDKQQKQRYNLLHQLVPNWYPTTNNNNNNNNNSKKRKDKKEDPEQPQQQKQSNDTDTMMTSNDKNKPDHYEKIIEKNVSNVPIIKKSMIDTNHTKSPNTTNNHSEQLPLSVIKQPRQRTLHTPINELYSRSKCPNLNKDHDSNFNYITTLVVQGSYDRIWLLRETCHRYLDPIIVVIGLTFQQYSDPVIRNHLLTSTGDDDDWKKSCPQVTIILHNIEEKEKEQKKPTTTTNTTTIETNQNTNNNYYPVNVLRNLALDAVQTSHVLVLDIDFIPSYHLHTTIRKALQTLQQEQQQQQEEKVTMKKQNENENRQPIALVIPAFEKIVHPPCTTADECKQYLYHNSTFIPMNFTSLYECYRNQQEDKKSNEQRNDSGSSNDHHFCTVFQAMNNIDGHSSTKTNGWMELMYNNVSNTTSTIPPPFRTIECFDSSRYEPYVVIPWCPITTEKTATSTGTAASNPKDDAQTNSMDEILAATTTRSIPLSPYYDERFVGYGKNKIQYVAHLRYLGYQFRLYHEDSNFFIVHNPHLESNVKLIWNDRSHSTLHTSMDQLYELYLRELHDKYIVKSNNNNNTSTTSSTTTLLSRMERITGLCQHEKKKKKGRKIRGINNQS